MLKKLFTVGYTGLGSAYDLAEIARNVGGPVVDVRLVPRSRRPEWAKSNLARALTQELGDGWYYHDPDLGNLNYNTSGIKIRNMKAGTARVGALLETRPVILLCVCKEPGTCHRTTVSAFMEKHYGVEVEHLEPARKGRSQLEFDLPKAKTG